MMIRTYRETYLCKAQSVLGEAFDYAVNSCKITGEEFVKLFIVSTVSRRMENGEPSVLAGKSGMELVIDVIHESTGKDVSAEPQVTEGRTVEYWIGWALAYYQWWSGRRFSSIFEVLGFADLHRMYYMLHEADISEFAEAADAIIREHYPDTNLKRIRCAYGCSQAELAEMSGVSLRSIQMYEQRNKDINRASTYTVFRLSKSLGCSMEELIESQPAVSMQHAGC